VDNRYKWRYTVAGENKSIVLKRLGYLRKTLDSIFSVSDEPITASIIQTIYDIASPKKIPTNIVESTTFMPQYLSSETRCSLYLFVVASTEMLENCNKALLSKARRYYSDEC
jgi:hypothetical protein